jgi:hypothetical protein
MTTFCHFSAQGAPGRHEIPAGARRLELRFDVDWGDDDIRGSHSKPLTFCSFGCLAGWAAERGVQHDGSTLKDGSQ